MGRVQKLTGKYCYELTATAGRFKRKTIFNTKGEAEKAAKNIRSGGFGFRTSIKKVKTSSL